MPLVEIILGTVRWLGITVSVQVGGLREREGGREEEEERERERERVKKGKGKGGES